LKVASALEGARWQRWKARYQNLFIACNEDLILSTV
jgi:hypothetical protein